MNVCSFCRPVLLTLSVALCLTVSSRAANHNPAISSDSVIVLATPVESSPAVTVTINWPYGPAPTTGTLTVKIDKGTDQICLVDDDGANLTDDNRSWSSNYPTTFKIRAKAPSSAVDDVVLNIQHDTGPVGSKKLTVAKIELKSVSFSSNDTPANYFELKSDDDATTYSAPHWLDNSEPLNGAATDEGDRKYASAFIRNTKPKIAAKFKVTPSTLSNAFQIEAAGPTGENASEGFKVSPAVTTTPSDGVLTLAAQTSAEALPNTIKYYSEASIIWKVATSAGPAVKVATSTHRVYVIRDTPVTPLRQESLFYIGCNLAYNEAEVGDGSKVTTAIWGAFSGKDVKRVDGTQLTYYADYRCANLTTASLLSSADGQCGAWVRLFLDVRKAQGIADVGNNHATFIPISEKGFIVKNWTFNGAGTSGNSFFPYRNIASPTNCVAQSSYAWFRAEVTETSGTSLGGQGNANPASLFVNHETAYLGGVYYDVSYGVTYSAVAGLDAQLDGLFTLSSSSASEVTADLDLNGDGDKTDTGVQVSIYDFRKNAEGDDISSQLDSY